MKQHLFIWIVGLLLVGIPVCNYAQTPRIDSLKRLIHITSNPEARLSLFFAFCDEGLSLSSDTLYAYAMAAQTLAIAQNDNISAVKADYYLCNVLLKNSLFDTVITISEDRLKWLDQNKGPQELKNNFHYIAAQAQVRNNHFKEALTQYYKMLNGAEVMDDTLMQVRAKTGIGWIHMEMNQFAEALHWFKQALATTSNNQYLSKYGVVYSNLASVYNNLNQLDSATYFVNKALEGARRYQVLTNLANALYIQADIFMNSNNSRAAEASLHEALEVRRRIGDPFYIVSDIAQLSNFYAVTRQYEKGIDIANQGIHVANRYKIDAKLPMLYTALAQNMKAKGDYKSYSQVQEKLLMLKDSLYHKNSAEALANLQAKYNLQRKENIIIQKNLDIVQKDYRFYGTLTLFSFLLILIFILYQNHRKRQKSLLEKLLKEQQQKETIAIIKAEEKERKRIAADLHDNLGAYASAISANVKLFKDGDQYVPKLTQRIEENVEGMLNQLSDTIWVLKKQSQLLTEVTDRLKVWMQKLMHNYPGIQYDFEEYITDDMVLSPAHALNLFYMLQECVNNALKHSNCSHVLIRIGGNDQKLKIDVTDNGKGFTLSAAMPGNGLNNIRQRAASCNWQVSWQTGENKGTTVSISSINPDYP